MAIRPALILSVCIASLSLPAHSAEKMRLGDVSDPSEKKGRKGAAGEPSTVEERRELMSQVVDDFYRKGVTALSSGQWEIAEDYFDRVLTLDPQHKGARFGLTKVLERYQAEEARHAPARKEGPPKSTPTGQVSKEANLERLFDRAVERGKKRETAGDLQGAFDAYQVALSYRADATLKEKAESLRGRLEEKNRKNSDELYLEALRANQQGDVIQAFSLCKRALDLNPKNIQAQRMLERLESKQLP